MSEPTIKDLERDNRRLHEELERERSYRLSLEQEKKRLEFLLDRLSATKKDVARTIQIIVEEIDPQGELVYQAMKKGGSLYTGKSFVEKRKQRAKACLKENPNPLLRPEFLDDGDLYIFKRRGQAVVDFKGKWYQKVVKYLIGKDWEIRDLGERARKINKLKRPKRMVTKCLI